VTVTGGAGFLGSYVCEKLSKIDGVDVFVPRRESYDLTQKRDIVRMLQEAEPEMVIHLAAAVGGIGHNQRNPGKLFYDNLMMGVQLMEECRLAAVQKFVAIGTVCAYPKFTPAPFQEKDLWIGYPEETNAAYGLAKKMMLVQAQSYRAQYGFDSIFLLPSNLYGPRQNFDLATSHVIPALIRKCIEARRNRIDFIDVWGSGLVSRDFLYVDDCADGIIKAAACYDKDAPVNLGTGRETVLRDLVSMISKLTGFAGEIRWDATKPDGQPRRQLGIERAMQEFGFEASTLLEDGLRKTIEWYESVTHRH
jgi:GDP-L-fucose synthase